MVRITAARPMAKRHRGGNATLARVDPLAVFGGEEAQIERIDVEARILENLARDLGQPKRLGDFPRAGSIVAGRADDEQNARAGAWFPAFRVRALQPRAGVRPFDRQVVLGIGISLARCSSDRRLATILVGLPCDILDPRERRLLRREQRVLERLREAVVKLDSGQRRGGLALADLGHGGILAQGAGRKAALRLMTRSVADY